MGGYPRTVHRHVGAAIAGMVAWSFLAMHAALSMPIQLGLLVPFDDIAGDADCTNATAFAELFAAIDCSTTPNCGYRDWRDACRAVVLTPYVLDLFAATMSVVLTTYFFVVLRPVTFLPEIGGSKDWKTAATWLFFCVPSSPCNVSSRCILRSTGCRRSLHCCLPCRRPALWPRH